MENKPKRYTANLRLWHWLNAVVISGSLLTVLINSTLLDRETNSALLSGELKDAGTKVSEQQLRAVSHGLSELVWNVHVYVGYFLIALLIYRLVGGLLLAKKQHLYYQIKTVLRLFRQRNGQIGIKDPLIKLLYLLFYAMLLFMAVSGLGIKFHQQIGLSNATVHGLKEAHETVMYAILLFIVVHIVGVIIAERGNKRGIVSDMINGGKAGY